MSEYGTPHDITEQLSKDLESFLEANFPKGSELSPLLSERFRHTTFSKQLTRHYLANEKSFMNLEKYCNGGSNKPFALLGEVEILFFE